MEILESRQLLSVAAGVIEPDLAEPPDSNGTAAQEAPANTDNTSSQAENGASEQEQNFEQTWEGDSSGESGDTAFDPEAVSVEDVVAEPINLEPPPPETEPPPDSTPSPVDTPSYRYGGDYVGHAAPRHLPPPAAVAPTFQGFFLSDPTVEPVADPFSAGKGRFLPWEQPWENELLPVLDHLDEERISEFLAEVAAVVEPPVAAPAISPKVRTEGPELLERLVTEPLTVEAPRGADLLPGAWPIDLSSLEQSMQRFFEQLAGLGKQLVDLPGGMGWYPWLVAGGGALLVAEVLRRRSQPAATVPENGGLSGWSKKS